ncbi:MAG: glycosyltransferase, partial [Methanobacteriota archaeon]
MAEKNLKKNTIVVISALRLNDVYQDVELLKKHFLVNETIESGWKAIPRIIKNVKQADVCFSWFASMYSFVMVLSAQMLGKKTIIQLGGVDTAADPDLNYGIWITPWKAPFIRYALRHADRVLAIHHRAITDLRKNSGWSTDSVLIVPTGYDPTYWKPAKQKQHRVLTVAKCDIPQRIFIKGIDWLIQVAQKLPNISFDLVGAERLLLQKAGFQIPGNLTIHPPVERENLLHYYQQAKVYFQPSRYEGGFPNTVCEAMLCGCIPVGSNVGGIPEAIKEYGFVVERGNVQGMAKAIQKALDSDDEVGLKGREYIAQNFTL